MSRQMLVAIGASLMCSYGAGAEPLSTVVACTTEPVAEGKTLIVVVGDSITFGFNCKTWHGGYVKVLQDILGTEKYDVRDCGVSGTDAVKPGDGEIKHPSYWTEKMYKNATAMKPNIVIAMFGTNDADEWCLSQTNSTCPGGTSKHFFDDFTAMLAGFKSLPSVSKTYAMIPPPYSYMQVVKGTFLECPPSEAQCPKFNSSAPAGEKEFAKACIIDCVLPTVVTAVAQGLSLPPPVDMLSLLGFPKNTNKSAIPGLHPSCGGYELMGRFIGKELFGVH